MRRKARAAAACAAAAHAACAAHRLDGSVVVSRNAKPAIAPPEASVIPTEDASATCATALPPAASAGAAAASRLTAAAAAATTPGRTSWGVPEANTRDEAARARRTRTGALSARLPATGSAIASRERGAGRREAFLYRRARPQRRPSSARACVALPGTAALFGAAGRFTRQGDEVHPGASRARGRSLPSGAWCAPRTAQRPAPRLVLLRC